MGLGTHIRGWGERAQERARRNAMVATNELLARRQEREDVDEFLGRIHARREAAAGHRLQAAHQVHQPAHRPTRQISGATPATSSLPSEHRPAAAQA